jgi:hypothetical protein
MSNVLRMPDPNDIQHSVSVLEQFARDPGMPEGIRKQLMAVVESALKDIAAVKRRG